MIKHRHLLDLSFLKESLTVQNNVQILYTKPEATARDSRNLCQSALATFHSSFLDASWQNSSAVKEGKIGPCPLIRVSDMQGFDDDARPNPSARAEQKGTGCCDRIMSGLLAGMTLEDADRIYWVDVLPNEFCEFGRAAIERAWEGNRKVLYVGFLSAKQYGRTNEEESLPPPDLQVLAWDADWPVWPEVLSTRFDAGTEECKKVLQKKAELEAAYPPADRRGCGGGVARGRVGGMCDFGIDELRPLDINRALSPPAVTDADFQPEREGRLGMCEGKAGKPSIVIASNLNVWIGNGSDEDMNYGAQELFGFGVGAFEEREVRHSQFHARCFL
ncbi:FO synthase subunit 1 [Durusdinium trenchii]|uniref:FO synthase subunit 1 n=1 Tax=Durusdinium trenchii TaxID=1381693 RepID=A0ABP0SST8_9DINO